MAFLILPILLGLIPAAIAKGKGYSFGGWWFYGALIFIVALPHALLIRPNLRGLDNQAWREGLRKCPFCAEFIKPEALVCKHCGRELPARGPKLIIPLASRTERPVRAGMAAWKWILAIGVPFLILLTIVFAMQQPIDKQTSLPTPKEAPRVEPEVSTPNAPPTPLPRPRPTPQTQSPPLKIN
jgi:hypothetical protein